MGKMMACFTKRNEVVVLETQFLVVAPGFNMMNIQAILLRKAKSAFSSVSFYDFFTDGFFKFHSFNSIKWC